MVVISKPLFYEKIGNEVKCDSLHYWAKGCVQGNRALTGKSFVGSLKFFLPLYLVKAVINYKKLQDKQYLANLLVGEIRSGIFGLSTAHLLLLSNCILSKLSGRINYYNLGFMSGLISGLSILVETKENMTLNTFFCASMVVDAIFRNIDYFNIVKLTRTKETFIFMLVSGILMQFLQNKKKSGQFTNLWFYVPHKFKEENDEETNDRVKHKCDHKESCVRFTLKGTQTYFVMGFLFSALRQLIPNMLMVFKRPDKLLRIFFNKDNVKFGTFIGAYVGLYRFIMCFLRKSQSSDQKYHEIVAGFLCGATYSICPNLQLIILGITILLQIFYHNFLKSFGIKRQFIPDLIIFMLLNGILFHNAVMCQGTCPSSYMNLLNSCSSNVFQDVYREFVLKNFSVK